MASISYAAPPEQFLVNPAGQFGHTLSRPWTEVKVTIAGASHRIWCLLDTGADFTVLDLGTAAKVNVDPSLLPKASPSSAGGTVPMRLCTGVQLEFVGATVATSVLFGNITVPLLGRPDLLNGIGVGFTGNPAEWHHT